MSETEIAEEKEIISISVIQAKLENEQGKLEEEKFSNALNMNSKEENKASIEYSDAESYIL